MRSNFNLERMGNLHRRDQNLNYPADGCFGNWGVVFEYTDKFGNECISNTERGEFFFTLAEAKDYFHNGGAVETWEDAAYGRIYLTQI